MAKFLGWLRSCVLQPFHLSSISLELYANLLQKYLARLLSLLAQNEFTKDHLTLFEEFTTSKKIA